MTGRVAWLIDAGCLMKSAPGRFDYLMLKNAIVAMALLAGVCRAGEGPSGCDDLSGIAVTPAVDYESQIEPIFSGCTGCHGSGGAADLDLRPGQAYANLVGVTATTSPDAVRVVPFAPESSLLLSAVNCEVTGGPSFQMPGTNPEQRALIRDWIAQGAAEQPAPAAVPALQVWGTRLLVLVLMLAGGLHAVARAPAMRHRRI